MTVFNFHGKVKIELLKMYIRFFSLLPTQKMVCRSVVLLKKSVTTIEISCFIRMLQCFLDPFIFSFVQTFLILRDLINQSISCTIKIYFV